MTEIITAKIIVDIHDILVEWFAVSDDPISPSGVRDIGLLKSAASRPYQSAGGQPAYCEIFGQSAALFHSLINNHAFHNGNKRVALVSAQVMLAQGGWWIERPSDEEVFEFTRAAASHELDIDRANEVAVISK